MVRESAHPSGIDTFRPGPRPGIPKQLQASYLLWLAAVAAGVFETGLVVVDATDGEVGSAGTPSGRCGRPASGFCWWSSPWSPADPPLEVVHDAAAGALPDPHQGCPGQRLVGMVRRPVGHQRRQRSDTIAGSVMTPPSKPWACASGSARRPLWTGSTWPPLLGRSWPCSARPRTSDLVSNPPGGRPVPG
jgi:hypothetical protein